MFGRFYCAFCISVATETYSFQLCDFYILTLLGKLHTKAHLLDSHYITSTLQVKIYNKEVGKHETIFWLANSEMTPHLQAKLPVVFEQEVTRITHPHPLSHIFLLYSLYFCSPQNTVSISSLCFRVFFPIISFRKGHRSFVWALRHLTATFHVCGMWLFHTQNMNFGWNITLNSGWQTYRILQHFDISSTAH